MAGLWRRWRTPLLGGIAVWLLSFPLLTSHPAPITAASAAQRAQGASVEAGDHRVFLQRAREEQAALAAMQVLAAAAATPNTIVIPRLGLSQPVGWYSDCMGRAPVPRWGAWRWSCAGVNNIYVMAHNPGVFTPILGLRAGDIVLYGDPSGRVHTYRVSSTTIVSNTQMWPLGATPSSSLTLQTCWTWDGSRDFIVRALEI